MSGFLGSGYAVLSAAVVGTLTVLAAPVMADDKLHYGPVEPWVTAITPVKPDPARSGAPAQILWQHTDGRFAPEGGYDFYRELAIHIQTVDGLKYAQAQFSWNPATDTATVNKLQILRDGKVIDLLTAGQTFTTLRREENLDMAMLDGNLTGVIQPEGLQVGDTLVFGRTVRQRDPVFGAEGRSTVMDLDVEGVARQVFRLSWDASTAVRWRQSDDLKGRVVKTATTHTYVLERDNTVAAKIQADAPARFNVRGLAEFSQFRTWNELSALMAPLYEKAAALTPDSPLRKEAAAIRAASADPKVQAAMALKLVQNQVRYVFLGMDLGGYVPASAEATWQRRFGDCKGKTVLLLALLHELGIKADAALVDVDGGDGLDEYLPGVEVFDHVIVRTEIGGKIYWLDGTRLGDRDLDSLTPPYVRWALPVTKAGATLEAVPVMPLREPSNESFLKLDASAGLDAPARAHAEDVFRGDIALEMDASLRAVPAADRDVLLKGYWTERYAWITPGKVSSSFDTATGEYRVVMDGTGNMPWYVGTDGKSWWYQTDIMLVGWQDEGERAGGPQVSVPVATAFPYYRRTRQEIILPKGGKGFRFEGAPLDMTVAQNEIKRLVSLQEGVLKVEASQRTLAPEMLHKEMVEADPVMTELGKDTVYLVAPAGHRRGLETAGTPEADATTAYSAADKLVLKAEGLEDEGKADEALATYNKALREEPDSLYALIGRGANLSKRGKFDAALADLQRAVGIDPSQHEVHNMIGNILDQQGKTEEAVDAYTRAIEVYPNSVHARYNRARIHAGQGRIGEARQDADYVRDLDTDTAAVAMLLGEIELADNRPEAAVAILEPAVAAAPDNVSLRASLAMALVSCTELEAAPCMASRAKAVTEYDAIIAAEPSSWAYTGRARARPVTDRKSIMADLDAAIALDDKDTLPYVAKFALLMDEKAYDEALVVVEKVLTLSPDDAFARSTRAGLYMEANRIAEGLAEYDSLKETFPEDADIRNSACYHRATRNIDLATALADCEAGVALAPDSYYLIDSRGFVKLRLERYDDAIADFNAALALKPDLPDSLYGRGLAKLRKGDKAGGEADLKAARKVSDTIEANFAGWGLKP